jgi:hypothetical protein
MPGETVEVLDTNIVALFQEPALQIPNLGAVFATDEFAPLLRPPLEISQALQIDATNTQLGAAVPAVTSFQIESMRSQKTLAVSPLRLEAHDRSGREEARDTKLPELFTAALRALGGHVKAVGANFNITFKASDETTAASSIAKRVLTDRSDLVPDGMAVIGGSAHILVAVAAHPGVAYTLGIEPRGNDLGTNQVWMTCNANVVTSELPTNEQLYSLLDDCRRIVMHVKESIVAPGS